MKSAEFESHLQDKVRLFLESYVENMRDDPDNWPPELGVSDWWEQFYVFVEQER